MEEKLFNKKEIGWTQIDTREREAIYSYCNGYMNFMNKSKTEREAVVTAKAIAESNGFRDLSTYETLQPGDKVYFINREKSIYLAVIGTEKLENGIQIVGAHIDHLLIALGITSVIITIIKKKVTIKVTPENSIKPNKLDKLVAITTS